MKVGRANPFVGAMRSVAAGSNNRTKTPKTKARSVTNPTSGRGRFKARGLMKQKKSY